MLSLGRDAPGASLEIIALDQLTLWTVTTGIGRPAYGLHAGRSLPVGMW